MRNIEFVSYNGRGPVYCFGTLVLSIDGVEHSFGYAIYLTSLPNFDEDWMLLDDDPDTTWKVRSYREHQIGTNEDIEFTDEEIEYIEQLVNDNVPAYHCGGCS